MARDTSKKTRSEKGVRRSTKTRHPPAPSRAEATTESPPPASRRVAATSQARRLDAILRALPAKELEALIDRMGIRVDSKKRIDVPAQVARALVRLPDVREPSRLVAAAAELLHRIAEVNGSLTVASLPAGVEVLVRRGIVYALVTDAGIELMLPTAFLVQLRSWEGEDPRSLRALLSEAPFETASAVASHYLGRPSTPPIALSLEPAWEVLGDPEALKAELEQVSHQERRLLDQIEQVGGEVDTQELMDLEREPMRVRGAYGVAAGRRGAAFSLEKRGLLFPLHPNRYALPTEVAAIIGAERRHEREQRRQQIRSHVMADDHLPRRASFAEDPAPLAVSMAMAFNDGTTEVRSGVGTPRSLVARLANRFGRSPERAALLTALSRAVGLWEGACSAATPPGSLRLWELSALLFDTWRRGGAWDEARSEPEMLRVPPEHRDPSPVGVLREMVLDALSDLGEGQWVPYSALVAYLQDDPRLGGLRRLFERWGKRVGVDTPDVLDVAQRILVESLPGLGVVDLGGADVNAASGSGELTSLALRLSPRGRRLIGGDAHGARGKERSEFTEPRSLRIGCSARVAQVLELATFTDLGAVDGALELVVSPGAVTGGLSHGIHAGEMLRRLAELGPVPAELEQALSEADTILGRGNMTATAAFLWIDDVEVRELLAQGPSTRDLFVDPSPPGGLLVAPGADLDKLARRCRAVGVDVELGEGLSVRSRSSTAPPPHRSDTRRMVSWRPPAPAKGRKRG